jgi:hypothetical protein
MARNRCTNPKHEEEASARQRRPNTATLRSHSALAHFGFLKNSRLKARSAFSQSSHSEYERPFFAKVQPAPSSP